MRRRLVVRVLLTALAAGAVTLIAAGSVSATPVDPLPPAVTSSPEPPAPSPTLPVPSDPTISAVPLSPGSGAPDTPPDQPPVQAPASTVAGCGMFDVGCKVQQAINGFFRGLVTSALNPVFRCLARSVLAAQRVDQMERVHSMWTTSAWIANSGFVVLLVVGGMLLMGYQTLQTSYAVKDVAPRFVIAVVAANMNLLVLGPAIDFANALSAASMGRGVDPRQAADTLKGLVLKALTDGGDVFMPVLALVAVVAGLFVLIAYVVRAMLLVLLAAAAPLALACHALPQSDGLARLWWRALAGVLAIQVAQSLVFAAAMRVFFASDQMDLFGFKSGKGTFDLLRVICLLYILARIPAWVSQMVLRGGARRNPITRMARTVLIFRGLGGRLAGSHAVGPARMPRLPVRPQTAPAPSRAPAFPSFPSLASRPRWVQPELPLGRPPSHAEQLELPMNVPARTASQPRWTQLRLPDKAASPPHWRQPALPFPVRHEQTRLPAPPRRHVQPPLPLAFPDRGTPQAGRSPRRLADQAALRHAEARARQRRRRQ